MNCNSFLEKLEGVRETGEKEWQARCPAHDDNRASLSVACEADGTILLMCHAGCETPDVVKAAGLKMSDLFPANNNGNGQRRIVDTYDYLNADRSQLFQVVRFEPKDFRQRKPKLGGGWEWNVKGCEVVPYRLPELLAADMAQSAYVVEGEKDADRLAALGLVATCNAGGAGKWRPEHAQFLAGRAVVVLPDYDDAGRKHGQRVAKSLLGKCSSVKIVELPGLPKKGDVSDWLDAGGTVEQLQDLVDAAEECETLTCDGKDSVEKKEERKSQATVLIELASEVGLFHDADDEGYAQLPVGEGDDRHLEVSRVRARGFRRWLSSQYFRKTRRAPTAQALQDAIGLIEAHALYDGSQRDVFVRIAGHEGRIYLDLCNEKWQAVEIDCDGFRVVNDPPVMFRRAKAMLSLPLPDQRGNIDLLRRFVNVSDDDWPLLLAWLVTAMLPSGPFPVLAVYGEHGSAKSTLCRYVRKIVDPNTAPLRADYREPRDLMICANNGWIIALDNLSSLRPWLSDSLCRLATGGGFSTRTLYENDEETIFDAKRPVILNCIEEVATRSDLLDRCVTLNLPRIDSGQRIPEAQLDREFDEALPRTLGGLLQAVSAALRNESNVKLPNLPRMADFAIWATAAEPALGLEPGEFMKAYAASRKTGNEIALEASPVGKVLVDFVGHVGQWSGTATELLHELEERAEEKTHRLKSWPATARTLGAAVKRLAPNLREEGIDVEFGRTGRKGTRTITLSSQPEQGGNFASATSATSASHEFPETSSFSADATDNADATDSEPLSVGNSVFPDENGCADATDNADAKIPAHSLGSDWGVL